MCLRGNLLVDLNSQVSPIMFLTRLNHCQNFWLLLLYIPEAQSSLLSLGYTQVGLGGHAASLWATGHLQGVSANGGRQASQRHSHGEGGSVWPAPPPHPQPGPSSPQAQPDTHFSGLGLSWEPRGEQTPSVGAQRDTSVTVAPSQVTRDSRQATESPPEDTLAKAG